MSKESKATRTDSGKSFLVGTQGGAGSGLEFTSGYHVPTPLPDAAFPKLSYPIHINSPSDLCTDSVIYVESKSKQSL